MPKSSHNLGAESIDDIARLLSQVTDAGMSRYQADELIDEISRLLWTITDQDPEGEVRVEDKVAGAASGDVGIDCNCQPHAGCETLTSSQPLWHAQPIL